MQPFISILIPIHNEVDYIERCLNAVLHQDYSFDRLEVLIADGMSDDGTQAVISRFQENYTQIYLYDNPGRIVPIGLNILIPNTKGEILIRVDGHCIIAPDYVSNCVRHLQDSEVDGVGGPIQTIGEDFTSRVIALAMSSKFGVGNSSFRTEAGQTKFADTVPFPAYTRSIIDKVGLYDEELVRNQDDEYNYRIRGNGGKILLADDVRSTYYSRGSLGKLWKQYFQYGYWKVRVLQKHPKQMSLRQLVPPVFVLGLITLLIMVAILKIGWIVFIGYTGLYLLANLATSIVIACRKGCKYFWLLPVAFVTIHISYGLGFLLGLMKFWNRWGDKIGKNSVLD
ncbi:MAG: glycosyltransferase family 2 protein [Anaerolineaceae bacterium]|nr:glycosyltransferase family 2 protein [Anaerolineaceae bacterium]